MGRRKKKKNITYDSKETATVLGLSSFLIGGFLFLSFLTSTSEAENNILAQAKEWFNDGTIFASLFLIILGARLLGAKFPFTSRRSIISQLFFVVFFSGLLTSLTAEPRELIKLSPEDTNGGRVGFYIVTDLLGDTIPTEPLTKLILIIFTVLLGLMSTGLPAKRIVAEINKILVKIKEAINYLFALNGDDENKQSTKSNSEQEVVPRAKRFGDLNQLLVKRKEDLKKGSGLLEDKTTDKTQEENSKKYSDINQQSKKQRDANKDLGVDIKEAVVGEDGLNQEELKFPNWKLPPASLLIPFKKTNPKDPSINQNARIIEQILQSFDIEATVEETFIGPSVIQYALNIPLGVNVKKISNLSDNLALALGVDTKAVRIDTIPETTFLGIEVPRSNRDMVRFKEIFTSDSMKESSGMLPVTIGKDINGDYVIGRIEKMPHLLIAGATGSGKSVLTNSFITSLIMNKTPDELKLILVDPKQVELIDYDGIPHLLTPVITDMDKVLNALKWLVGEMERRYTIMANARVRNIEGYNEKKGFAAMPYIVVVIDEMADMMMTANKAESENAIVRLAQKARAVGIHLILATQRPSVNVITGIIKANIPGRVGMSVTSSTDSRVILDRIGAESLMGKGDLLYKAPDKTKASRLQGANIEQPEIERIVDFIKAQAPEVEYVTSILEKQVSPEEAAMEALGEISGDNLVEQAIRIVVQSQKGSSSFLQRRLNIGFNRAARLLEELEEAGVVGPANGSKPREVLISDADSFIGQLRAGG